MDKIFIFLQYIVPQHLLSRMTGWLAELEHPVWLKSWVIGLFINHFKVDMSEAAEPDHEKYPNFNAFFTRPLLEGARPLASADVVCPADGAISQLGDIVGGRIFQAKGQDYSAFELLGGDAEWAERFAGGKFATIYLSPRDYHRVHMPVAGRLLATTYVPGDLFSVNGTTAENVDRLFARNERLVCYFETGFGPMAMILVGAMVVAGIETVWGGQVAPPPKTPQSQRFDGQVDPVELARGDEMGRFKLGSTVILLFPENSVEWDEQYQAGTSTTLGQALASAVD
ncbi:phosphatidylserine decarboxylase [Halioglobus japonicus]|uniref:Phosphatidylserine decarboxylase proenzyme n=1 Tax=Halioglobus japonicus TaxID=930805 RepID=A0AAP8SLU6_9GAMM|nr:archaetidylserine decarboxylase [Halioglobus japonicus]AQA20078.1 phosphatidylserine decarboxylase [Halioglobus japonicus]PLW84887.1 phosphatidylserine decarboxylase [Halioglobus japonicus]